MRALLIKEVRTDGPYKEADFVVMFDGYKPVEVTLTFRERHTGEARLHVFVEGLREQHIDLTPKEG
jgi:hypothetical protein